jgi:ribulose-5-phosphate 4-epimerase/fuculose-1-phosphate aldolase
VRDLGNKRNLILRNHGLLTVGTSPGDAFLAMYLLETACRIQVRAQGGGAELLRVDQKIIDEFPAQTREVTRGLGSRLVWPALLRRLDRLDPTFRN